MTVLCFLDDYPTETNVIGRIIIAYSELENALVDLVGAVLDEDGDMALRTLFRLRSEGQRLDVADAVARKWMQQQKMVSVYGQALGAIRHCKSIRNQYAHCVWYAKNGRLLFINLEEAARSPSESEAMLAPKPVDLPLLQKQLEFFDYAEALLIHVADTYREKMGRAARLDRPHPRPKQTPRPKLHL